MKIFSVRTAGTRNDEDYKWRYNTVLAKEIAEKLATFISTEKKSLVVQKEGDGWNLFISGLETGQIDFANRKIRLTVLFGGLSTAEMRDFAIRAFEDWEALTGEVLKGFAWGKKGKDDTYGWQVEYGKLESILNDRRTQHDEPFEDAWEYEAGDEAKQRVLNDLRTHNFSGDSGIKLLYSEGYMRSPTHEEVRESADRILVKDGGPHLDLIKYRDEIKKKLSNVPSKRSKISGRNWLIIITLILAGLLGIFYLSPKKKAHIIKIEPYGMPSPALIVHFDRPMDTATFPEIQIGPNGLGVEKMKWLNPTEMKVELALPDVIEVQIKGARAADGGGVVPYRERISLEKPTK